MARTSPNIIVTGTPGVGKTSHAEMLAEKTGLKHLAVNKVAEENNCYDGRDEELQTWIVDEDKVRDQLQRLGGNTTIV
jgi:adenylate kinase